MMPVNKDKAEQIKYGKAGCLSNSVAANIGPTMRARLPAPWATPIVAPCSCAGVRMEISPKTGGLVRLEPIDNNARTKSSSSQATPSQWRIERHENGALPCTKG